MTLDGLEHHINMAVRGKVRGEGFVKRNKHKLHLIRYADDFVVTASNPDILKEKVKPAIEMFLSERGLMLSEEKTIITNISEGYDFLGQNVRKYKDVLLIKPSDASFTSIKSKIKDIVDSNRGTNAADLIGQLNPVIRGWCNYHRNVAAKDTFAKLDDYIFKLLWKWAIRQHPNKPRTWIRKTYFKTIGRQNWRFAALCGKSVQVSICKAMSIPIVRYKLIKGEANPYDEEWSNYFASRGKKGFKFPQ
jgi:RNA-directed DNA polymerase